MAPTRGLLASSSAAASLSKPRRGPASGKAATDGMAATHSGDQAPTEELSYAALQRKMKEQNHMFWEASYRQDEALAEAKSISKAYRSELEAAASSRKDLEEELQQEAARAAAARLEAAEAEAAEAAARRREAAREEREAARDAARGEAEEAEEEKEEEQRRSQSSRQTAGEALELERNRLLSEVDVAESQNWELKVELKACRNEAQARLQHHSLDLESLSRVLCSTQARLAEAEDALAKAKMCSEDLRNEAATSEGTMLKLRETCQRDVNNAKTSELQAQQETRKERERSESFQSLAESLEALLQEERAHRVEVAEAFEQLRCEEASQSAFFAETRSQSSKLKEEFAESEEKLQSFERDLREAAGLASALRTELQSEKRGAGDATSRCSELDEAHQELKRDYDTAVKQRLKAFERCTKSEEAASAIERSEQALALSQAEERRRAERYEGQCQALREELDEERRDRKQAQKLKDAEVEHLGTRHKKDLQDAEAAHGHAIAEKEAELARLRSALRDEESQAQQQGLSLQALRQAQESSEGELREALLKARTELTGQADDLRASVERLNTELATNEADSAEEVDALRAERAELKQELSSACEDGAAQRAALQGLKQKVHFLMEASSKSGLRESLLSEELSASRAEAAKHSMSATESRADLVHARKQLKEASKAVRELPQVTEELQDSSSKLRRATHRVEDLESELQASRSQQAALDRQLREMRARLTAERLTRPKNSSSTNSLPKSASDDGWFFCDPQGFFKGAPPPLPRTTSPSTAAGSGNSNSNSNNNNSNTNNNGCNNNNYSSCTSSTTSSGRHRPPPMSSGRLDKQDKAERAEKHDKSERQHDGAADRERDRDRVPTTLPASTSARTPSAGSTGTPDAEASSLLVEEEFVTSARSTSSFGLKAAGRSQSLTSLPSATSMILGPLQPPQRRHVSPGPRPPKGLPPRTGWT